MLFCSADRPNAIAGGRKIFIRRPAKFRRVLLILLLAGLVLPMLGAVQNVRAAGVWTTAAPLPEVREGAAGGVVNGLIYVLKGYSFGDTGDVRIYNPTTNAWSNGNPSNNTGSEFYQGAVVNGLIYVIGGRPTFLIGSQVNIYNPATNSWSLGAPMPIESAGHATAVVNGKIYVIGGRTGDAPFAGGVLNTLQIYDPARNSWTLGPPLPTARSDLAAAVIGGIVYVIGGWNGVTTVGTVEAYDAAANTWSAKSPLPTPRGDLGAATCGSEGTIRAIGGASFNNTTLAINEAYNPSTNSWSSDTPMNVGRAEVTVVNLGSDTIYAIGGGFFGLSVADNEVFHCPVGPPGPSISLAASPASLTLMQGSSVNSTITVSSVNGFKGKVSLSSQVQPGATGMTTSFSPSQLGIHSGGSAQSLLTIRATQTATLGTFGITVMAVSTSGGVSASTGIMVVVVPSPGTKLPDFLISSNPSSVTLQIGSFGLTTITLNSLNGFSGPVSLSATPSTFALLAAVYPNTISLIPNGVSSAILIVEFPFQPPGTEFTVEVDASSASNASRITHSTFVNVSFQDFSLSSPLEFNTVVVHQGTSTTFPVQLSSINGFSGVVSLATNTPPSGLNWALPSSVFVSPNSTPNSTVVVALTISVAPNAAGGIFTLAVFATSGAIVHAFPATVLVPDFGISASPPSLTLAIQKGTSANATILLTSFLGFNGSVILSSAWVGAQPAGTMVTLTPQTLFLAPGTATSLLEVTLTKGATLGTFTLQVSAISGGLTRIVMIPVMIVKKL